jgi:hypothetical protein
VRHALYHEVRGLDTVIVHVDPCDCGETDAHAHTRSHDASLAPRPRQRRAGTDRSA